MNQAIVVGSIQDIAQRNGTSIAESFVNCDYIAIVDTSGSMASHDSRDGQQRYEVACQELAELQRSLPGKFGVIAFSSSVMFCPSGKPFAYWGGTDLAGALKFAKVADLPGMRFFVISDGLPDSERAALDVAGTYKNRIDVIYVGPETDQRGRNFLAKLAQASGGQAVTADRAKELAEEVMGLLEAGK